MAGRTPKLDGRKARLGARTITFETIDSREAPAPPGHLGPDGRHAWRCAMRSLMPANIVAYADLLALEAACDAWQEYATARARIADLNKKSGGLGGELNKTPNGHVQISSLRILCDRALKRFMHAALQFGMTPVARVKTSGTAQGDLFAGLEGPAREAEAEDDAPDPTDPFARFRLVRGGK